MGMVVIQPYNLVSKLKKIKTKFLCCTGYLNSIKKPYKARFIANSSSCMTTELSKLLTSCLKAVKKHVIKYCKKVYERSQSSRKRKITRIGTHVFSLGCMIFARRESRVRIFFTRHTLKIQ